MKRILKNLLLSVLLIVSSNIFSQCPNTNFENCNFNGWTGTYSQGGPPTNTSCMPGTGILGIPCVSVGGNMPDPFRNKGILQGTTNQASNATPENSHFIMNSGNDPIAGTSLKVVKNGSCSARLGNAQAFGGGESMMYKFVVTNNNALFTYDYAVVLSDGSHDPGQQPYFKIVMWVYNSPTDSTSINCASYDIDATLAQKAGSGFTKIGTDIYWKDWSSVTIPLQNYIGQTVSIQFVTRDCCPTCDANGQNGTSGGTHYAYAYIDASCNPMQIIPSDSAVCAGKTVTLTAPVGSASYKWTGPSANSIVSGGTTNVATVNEPGTYTVTMTTIGNSPCTYSLTATMPGSLPGGNAVLVNSTTICAGGSSILTATGGITYSWSPGGQTTQSINVTPASTSTYTVIGYSSSCGSGSAISKVTVYPIPNSPFITTPVCINAGSTITYTGSALPSDTYNWNFGTGTILSGSGQGPYSISYSSSGSKDITLQVTSGICTSSVTTNQVTVYEPPIINSSSTTVCIGSSGSLTASGGISYVWSNSNNTPTLTDSPTVTTTYTVTGTGANGCTGTGTGIINITPLQDPTFSYNPSTVCKTGGTNPTPLITGVTGGTFSCSDPNLSINTSGVVDLSLSKVGTYTITYTTPGPCPNSSTFSINIVNIPIADFEYGTYCNNISSVFPTFINGGTPGVFFSGSILAFVNTQTGEVNPLATTPGTYTVTNSINSPGCPLTTYTNTITVNAVPVTIVDNKTICNGSSATLTASGANSYLWSNSNNTQTLTDSPTSTTSYTVTGTSLGCFSSTIGTITVNPIPVTIVNNQTVCSGASTTLTSSGSDTYIWSDNTTGASLTKTLTSTTSYTVTGTSLGCSSSVVGTITVNPIPVVSVNSPNICQGNSVLLTAVGSDSYSWSNGSSTNPMSVTPPNSISYTVTGTSLGCSSTAVSNITITLLPVIKVNSATICIGGSTTLNASGGASYDWSTGSLGNTITVSPTTTTTYTVADNTPNCSGSTTVTVVVNQLPIISSSSVTICKGGSGTLNPSGGSTYTWSNNSTNVLTDSPITTTSYTVTGKSAAGCISSGIGTITVNPLPIITMNSATICEGLSATLTASGASTYKWSINTNTNPLIVSPTKTTTYSVVGTDVNGCSSSDSGIVNVFPKPSANFTTDPQIASVYYPTIIFKDQSSADVNSWTWDFGDGNTMSPNTKNPIHTYPSFEETYTIKLTVLNAGLCPDTITHIVIIGPEYSFFIPNAFSPDGDGINDDFNGKGKGIVDYELMIFDRWGNFIFYSDSIYKNWDGKANGGVEVAQQDLYVWKVRITDIFGDKHKYIGTVTIVRGK